MSDPIRDALDCLNQRLLPTLFSKGVDAAFLQSWGSQARAALATRPPADDDHDRAALQGLLDRMHLAATDPAAWLGLKQGEDQSPADAQPPAPAPVDIDALLSPEGAYERGCTGQEPGAQLVSGPNGPEWWVSRTAGDLEVLLFQIRARILPHLRPPVAGIDVPGCDGDYGDVMDLCAAEGVDPRVGVPLLKRAQEAWKVAARPPAPYVRPLAIEAGDAQQDYRSWLAYFEVGGNCGGGAKLSQENCRSLGALLRSLSPTPAPALDADTLRKVWREAAWGGRWATLANYIALALEAQRAPSGNPPATEEYLAEARQEIAELSPDLLAWRLLNLARVQARDGREYSSALCARAAELIQPSSDGEREELAPAELLPTRYIHLPSGVTIERTRTDPDAWAVRRGSERMSVWGEWSIEPSPSERFDDYLAKHSFSGPHAALEVLPPPPQGGEVQ